MARLSNQLRFPPSGVGAVIAGSCSVSCVSSSVLALLATALLGSAPQAAPAAPSAAPVRVASVVPRDLVLAAGAADGLDALMLGAMPDPPTVVVRQTRYYGSVTVDHRAHLARKASCKTCHGSGPITKLTFTPRLAHERCIGCHTQQSKGPTRCQGCHVRQPPPAVANPANVAAALAAFDAAEREVASINSRREPFHRWFELGVSGGAGQGLSLRVASHQNRIVLTQGLERMSSEHAARTIGLFGVGLTRPLPLPAPFPVRHRFSAEAVALVGFDVLDRPIVALMPALGLRAGVQWRPPFRYLRQVTGSVTTLVDLTRREFGRDVGGTSVYVTLATGFGGP
jgi:hypothetical protein